MSNYDANVLIRVILIDDDVTYAEELDGIAREYDIQLTHFSNLQKAKEELLSMTAVDFIILDAYCLVEEEDTAVDISFVSEARLAIKELEDLKGRSIPYCINTGFIRDDKLKRFKKDLLVFEKSKDHTKLLEHIKRIVENDVDFQIESQNRGIFEIFALGLLHHQYKRELLTLYKEVQQERIVNQLEPLKRMRPIIEAVLVHLNQLDETLISPTYFKRGVPNVSGIIRYLAGNPSFNKQTGEQEYYADKVIPEHIYYSTSATYSILSCALHHYEHEFTASMVKSCFYSVLEFLTWYKHFAAKHYVRV